MSVAKAAQQARAVQHVARLPGNRAALERHRGVTLLRVSLSTQQTTVASHIDNMRDCIDEPQLLAFLVDE